MDAKLEKAIRDAVKETLDRMFWQMLTGVIIGMLGAAGIALMVIGLSKP